MAKPMKAGSGGSEIIENPILSNFQEGLSVLEYFISTHGARKGLADTALKTADAGYLTRRLVDVAHDVIITEKDCGTLRGMTISRGEEIKEPGKHSLLYDRILGRVALHDVFHPQTNELIVASGEEINETIAEAIDESPLDSVEIRSVLTCESKRGVCANCYGRNLSSSKLVQKGEAVGVIAAQSIGEPGTQLTLRTFHQGGKASKGLVANSTEAKYDGYLEIEELRSVEVNKEDDHYQIVIGRSAELKLHDNNTDVVLMTTNIPYGAKLFFKNGDQVKKGDKICEWDPYNATIISEQSGKVRFQNVIEGVTYRSETIAETGFKERVIIEGRRGAKNPLIDIVDENGETLVSYDLPVDAHVIVEEGDEITAGDQLVRIPRNVSGGGDITGGLPRVQELFEARNSIDPAIVSEIDGIVHLEKKLKRGNREVVVTAKTGEEKRYLIPTSKQILAQENDFVKAGQPLSEGVITPASILAIMGPMKVQEYIVNEAQSVYRQQGVVINDKHFEVIVRQMMRKVEIIDPGDTRFLQGELVNKLTFQEENDDIYGKFFVEDNGASEKLQKGEIVSAMKLREEESALKRKDLALPQVRPARPATATQVLQGITRAALATDSFISAASFQETTKVLTNAAIAAKSDFLLGMKENVIVGHKIPAGTGLREYEDLIVGSREEYEELQEKAAAE
jgi:DNA-directed RNA polymerase subunit beta'